MAMALEGGNGLDIVNCCSNYSMTVSTFRRYLATLRAFFWQERGLIIVYDNKQKKYLLKK